MKEDLLRSLRKLAQDSHDLGINRIIELDTPPTPLEFLRFVMDAQPFVIRCSQRGPRQASVLQGTKKYKNETTSPSASSPPAAQPQPIMDSADPRTWPAYQTWHRPNVLTNLIRDRKVTVAITPTGRADALVTDSDLAGLHADSETRRRVEKRLGDESDGRAVFALPFEKQVHVRELLQTLRMDAQTSVRMGDVWYLQSQDNNLKEGGELEPLRSGLPGGIDFCTDALGREPDAVNFWLGSRHAVTSCHKDPYENIYVVLAGTKTFTLVPPTSVWALEERTFPTSRWQQLPSSDNTLSGLRDGWDLVPVYSEDSDDTRPVSPNSSQTRPSRMQTRWLRIDPDSEEFLERLTGKQQESTLEKPEGDDWEEEEDDEEGEEGAPSALKVTLHRGDMLYLPALWGHGVAQAGQTGTLDSTLKGLSLNDGTTDDSSDDIEDGWVKGGAMAVNYWYDMGYGRMFAYHMMTRQAAAALDLMDPEQES